MRKALAIMCIILITVLPATSCASEHGTPYSDLVGYDDIPSPLYLIVFGGNTYPQRVYALEDWYTIQDNIISISRYYDQMQQGGGRYNPHSKAWKGATFDYIEQELIISGDWRTYKLK